MKDKSYESYENEEMKTTSALRSLRKQSFRIDQSEASIYIVQAPPTSDRKTWRSGENG
jgi:hypothetical protein